MSAPGPPSEKKVKRRKKPVRTVFVPYPALCPPYSPQNQPCGTAFAPKWLFYGRLTPFGSGVNCREGAHPVSGAGAGLTPPPMPAGRKECAPPHYPRPMPCPMSGRPGLMEQRTCRKLLFPFPCLTTSCGV